MRSSRLFFLRHNLNQVAAGIVEGGDHNAPGIRWRLYETHTLCHEPLVFGFDVVDREGGPWDAIVHKGLLERSHRGMDVRFERQLRPIRIFFGYQVIQACSPRGILCFNWKPSVSV